MHKIVKTLYEEKGKQRKLFIAGHSLGAALATVAAARLAFIDNMHIAAIYTIGSPRYTLHAVIKFAAVRHNDYSFRARPPSNLSCFISHRVHCPLFPTFSSRRFGRDPDTVYGIANLALYTLEMAIAAVQYLVVTSSVRMLRFDAAIM